MPAPTISASVREVIKGDVNVPADDIIRRVRSKGITAPDQSIKDAIYNVKSDLRKAAKKKVSSKPAPAAARETKEPEPVATEVLVAAVVAPAPTLDLRAVFANVALVKGVLWRHVAGSKGARKVVEVVQACGGVESFLLHLDLIAQVRGATA